MNSYLKAICAAYIGHGCFIRVDDQKLAFVNCHNRPEGLMIGKFYELTWMSAGAGVLYFVIGEEKA